MVKYAKKKELVITTEDKTGILDDVTSLFSAQGINISAICAYSMEGKAVFMIVSEDSEKIKSAASSRGWRVAESETIEIELANKPGAIKEIANRLKSKGVNLKYLYGTTCECGPGCGCKIILKSDDDNALVKALK